MASAAEQLAANINWSAFAKADELKKRIWFTLGALVIYRLGTYIPLPGIDPAAFEASFLGQKQGVLDMFNMFSGGAVQRMAVFALNIMPYISASIIIQLLSSVVPSLEAIKKEGEQGRKILNQYTRYLTVVLALFQAYGISIGLEGRAGIVSDPGLLFRISTIVTLTGGTMFLVWLGEQITSRGVGTASSRGCRRQWCNCSNLAGRGRSPPAWCWRWSSWCSSSSRSSYSWSGRSDGCRSPIRAGR